MSRIYSESIKRHPKPEADEDFAEKGFLDIYIESAEAFNTIGNCALELSESTNILGNLIASHTEKLNNLGGSARKATQAHQIAAATARDLTNYSSELNQYSSEIVKTMPLLSESNSSLIEWIRTESKDPDREKEILSRYREQILSFGATISQTNTQIEKFKVAVEGVFNQRISRSMNRACKKVLDGLDRLMNTLDILEDFSQNTLELIDSGQIA